MPVLVGNKATFFFSDGRYGWSESYYDPVVNNTLQQTFQKATILAEARKQLLAGGPTIVCQGYTGTPVLTWIRISQIGVKRNTIFGNGGGIFLNTPVPLQGVTGKAIAPSANVVSGAVPDNPYSAVELVMSLNGGGQSKRPISGLPDAFICDQSFNANDAIIDYFKNFATALVTGSAWGALTTLGAQTNRNPTGGNPALLNNVAIASAQNTSALVPGQIAGQPVVTLAGGGMTIPTGYNCCSGWRMTIFCYIPNQGTPSLNGTYSVQPTFTGGNITSFIVKKVFRPLSSFCLGFAVLYQPQILPFTSVVMVRPTKRDRGRPFDSPHGRSRKRI